MEARFDIGVSLKMYFSHERTIEWCEAVAALGAAHPAITSGLVRLFIIPGYLSLERAVRLAGPLRVGAQDLSTDDEGAFTGEVSGAHLAELGCELVEVGHAERRRLFGETDAVVAAKVAAALRNGLEPVLCVGEVEHVDVDGAVRECVRQIESAFAGIRRSAIIAYEPVWAIGADHPAPVAHIRGVCAALRQIYGSQSMRVIYGGSAAEGLLTQIADDVDGMFLGRFAHDPAAVGRILDEALLLAANS